MAEQGRIVMPAAGAIGRRGQLTSNAIKLHNTYVASYDSGRMRFTYLRRPSETGFTSNQRPAIYYRPSLDHIDNPQFGLLLSDSFVSQTKRHYQPHIHSDCSGSSNIVNKPRHSGFHQLRIQPKAASVEEKGPEAKSGLCSRSCRETGFTRGDITPLAHPSSLLPSLSTKTNTKAPTVSTIGKKEPTGHVLNAQKKQVFPNATFDFSNFTTHYQSNFGHRADLEKLKSGNSCAGIVSSKMENGYNRRDMDSGKACVNGRNPKRE
ncbi:uncharacterized protein saxo4 isoform X4 [Archocentrus centrarchus]|uniref:uncharacterized protein saxo4 isoform X4 n=1 Tax=Archocentrus centrarchus TaxID=63155 RepID=UPI0011E9D4C3|nr:uncharacterized protein LOC115782298 isoform X4 [Archocentrus centrarchus]